MTALNALWTFTEISVRFIVLSRPRTCVIKRTVSLIIDLLEWALGGDVWFLKSPVEEMRNSSYSYWKWNFASWGLVITHLPSSMQTGRDYTTGDINTELCLASATTCECSSIVTFKLHTLHRSFYCRSSQYRDPAMCRFVSEWNEGQDSNQSARPSPLRRRGLRDTSVGRPASPWLQQRTGVTCLTTSSCRSSSTCPS